MLTYYKAQTLADALHVLQFGDGTAQVLAGGTDLFVGLRAHLDEERTVVDVKAVEDAGEPLTVGDDGVRIGLTLTMADLAIDKRIRQWYPALSAAAGEVGSVAIRNRATVVGNICNASPASDTAPALLVHEASVRIASLSSERTMPLSEFFVSSRVTRCGPGEIVTAIELPKPPPGTGSAYQRLTRRWGVDLVTVGVAAAVHGDGRVLLGLGAVGPTPICVELPAGTDVHDAPALAAALDITLAVATPITDIRGGADYRAAMLRVLASRAIAAALTTGKKG